MEKAINGDATIVSGLPKTQEPKYCHPIDFSKMTTKELNTEIQKGYDEIQAGLGIPADQAFTELYKEIGI